MNSLKIHLFTELFTKLLTESGLKQEQRIEEALQALMLFRVRQQTPCVLSLIREYKAKNIKKRHLEDALVSIEKFHYLFTAVTSQRSSGGISSMYASLGRRQFEATDTQASVDIIRELKEKLRGKIPSESELVALFTEIIYTENITKQKGLVKYTLVGLANENIKGIIVDFKQMTIEHLVPQSMIDKYDYSDAIIGQLGNLILVSEDLNGKLQNKSFQDKKKILQNEKYDLFPDVLLLSEMSPEIIEKRTKKLASRAYNFIWKI